MSNMVYEIHGAKSMSAESPIIYEYKDGVILEIGIMSCELTEHQARYLASKLYRLSRKIRDRNATRDLG